MSGDREVRVATELMRLGVSRSGIVDLLAHHPVDVIERQLKYLPLRKSRRPEALIIDAIRHDYSAPNPHHAKNEAQSRKRDSLDEGSEPPYRPADADSEGHGTADTAGFGS